MRADRGRAKGRLDGANVRKAGRFAYYFLFLLLFILFFGRAMFENPQGIFTGASQNLGDLPFHLGVISGFVDGNNFPPQNPSFAGAKFSYPFIADLLTACFVRLGAGVENAMFAQNVSWAFSLLVVLERFVYKLTGDRLAARLGPAILFFSGGLGFFVFFSDFSAQGQGLLEFLWHIPTDYTIGEKFRWGNSMVVMFITQRSLLLGMPLTIVLLGVLWRAFAAETRKSAEEARIRLSDLQFPFPIFLAGLLGGSLPLIHLHSLAVLFVVGVFLFILKPDKWLEWLAFAAGTMLTALPEIVWSMAGTATETAKFIGWHFGWDKGQQNFVWFWFTNTGLFIPLAAAGIYLIRRFPNDGVSAEPAGRKPKKNADQRDARPQDKMNTVLFTLPFIFLFVVSNAAKLAPWEWDNIKVLIYWFVGLVPVAAFCIAWVWRRAGWGKVLASAMLVVLCLSGGLDVWRTVSRQVSIRIFEHDAAALAERIKQATSRQALFLNAPTYNTAVALTGRRSLMRYTGHLSSHGIDYGQRENDVKEIYRGGPNAAALIERYGVDFVLISPEEKNTMPVNEAFFAAYPVMAQAGNYKVHRIRQGQQ